MSGEKKLGSTILKPKNCLPIVSQNFIIDIFGPFNNDDICRKALKSVSFVLNKFSQITNYYKLVLKGENQEMSSVSPVTHEERLFPQCFLSLLRRFINHLLPFDRCLMSFSQVWVL